MGLKWDELAGELKLDNEDSGGKPVTFGTQEEVQTTGDLVVMQWNVQGIANVKNDTSNCGRRRI